MLTFWAKNLSSMIRGGGLHLQSQSFIGLRLPWKFEPNPSSLNFCLIWGAPPFFCLKFSFGLSGERFLPPITIFYWSEVILKVWAKYELVEFLPDLGWSPNFFLLIIKFNFSSPIPFIHRPGVTLNVWTKSKLVEFFPDFGWSPLPFCAKNQVLA